MAAQHDGSVFDFAGQRLARQEPAASLQWMFGHLPLTAAVAAMGAAMLISASLQAWDRDRGLYRPLARMCAAVAVACLGVGAARPAPLILGLALVLPT